MTPNYRIAMDTDIFADKVMMVIAKIENGKRYIGKINWVEDDYISETPRARSNKDSDFTLVVDNSSSNGKKFLESFYYELGRQLGKGEDPTVKGLESEVSATKRHLEDMRTIVFKED